MVVKQEPEKGSLEPEKGSLRNVLNMQETGKGVIT